MSVRNLDYLFRPRAIAVIGGSGAEHVAADAVVRNLRNANYAGSILPVSAEAASVGGVPAVDSVSALPIVPDLAVVSTAMRSLPRLVSDLGARGTRGMLFVSHDGQPPMHADGVSAVLAAARPHRMRLVGPDSAGIIVPALGLNASLLASTPPAGRIALVSQSRGIFAGLAEWASARATGFSRVVSLGACIDVDAGDMLDDLGSDPQTGAILLYLNDMGPVRKFASAARAAARNKPVIVLAPAIGDATADARETDQVFDALASRAGMLRVRSTLELFAAAEALAHARPLAGDRLGVVANSDALCALACRAATADAIALAGSAERCVQRSGCVVVPCDAPPASYAEALRSLFADAHAGAALVVHAPSMLVAGSDIARACIDVAQEARRPVLSAWLGGADADAARRTASAAGMASYGTPEEAVRAFRQLVDYRRNQRLLLEAPASIAEGFVPDTLAVRTLVDDALSRGNGELGPGQAMALLRAYAIPVADPAAHAGGSNESRDDSQRRQGIAVSIAVSQHPLVGPVLRFGGSGADACADDSAVALPPLNAALARDLVSRTRVAGVLASRTDALAALHETLVKVSRLAADCPQLASLVVDPIVAGEHGVLAVAARASVRASSVRGGDHLAIRPYPKELEETHAGPHGSVMLRPVRPEDGPAHQAFLARVDPADLRLRFGRELREVPRSELARLTQIDYEREMAFVAVVDDDAKEPGIVGEIRAAPEPGASRAEFAIVVRSDMQRRGIGRLLLGKLVRYYRERGLRYLYGLVAADNGAMLRLAEALGFEIDLVEDSATAVVTLDLAADRSGPSP